MRIYLTHCTAFKDDRLKGTGKKVTADLMYKPLTIQRFIHRCKYLHVPWAIFSDLYGIWLPEESHEWYDKHPDKVNEAEFEVLVQSFDEKLSKYDEIWFYQNPRYFHPFYQRIIDSSIHTVVKFRHLKEIS